MGEKLWRKLGAWRAYMLREKEEKRESISLGEVSDLKLWVLTNGDQVSLNRQKDE